MIRWPPGQYFWPASIPTSGPELRQSEVLDRILSVMRFWLDIGVDGLRLDAGAYLIEREGTSNENLSETHDILKKIRAHLEERYTAACCWPSQYVAGGHPAYFGENGDECHMAFHFPLMPRMYMAIAKEDRFPSPISCARRRPFRRAASGRSSCATMTN